jgi:hypothetical protein
MKGSVAYTLSGLSINEEIMRECKFNKEQDLYNIDKTPWL